MTSHPKGIISQIARIRELSNQLIERELEAREIEGVQPAHGSVFAFLFQQTGPVPIKSIVDHTGRVKSTVTGMVNTLQRHGYVRKTPSGEDARVVYVELTKKGFALQPDFEEISDVLLNAVYGKMPHGDREALAAMLTEIRRNLENAE